MDTKEILYEDYCDDYLFEIVDKILNLGIPILNITICESETNAPIRYTLSEYIKIKNKLRDKKHYKISLRTTSAENGKRLSLLANELDLRNYIAVRSWNIGLEIMKKENAKGSALKKISQKIGSRINIGVGNYENDIELIKDADIGYAVYDAPDEIKAIADRITVSADCSALAKIIDDIEKEFC